MKKFNILFALFFVFIIFSFQYENTSPKVVNSPAEKHIKIDVGAHGSGDYHSELLDSSGSKIFIRIVVSDFCESKTK